MVLNLHHPQNRQFFALSPVWWRGMKHNYRHNRAQALEEGHRETEVVAQSTESWQLLSRIYRSGGANDTGTLCLQRRFRRKR